MQHVTAAGHPELMACGFQVKVLVSSSKKEVSVAHAQQEITVQHHWNRNLSNNQVLRSLSTSLDRDLPCICLQPVPDTTTSCCHGPLLAQLSLPGPCAHSPCSLPEQASHYLPASH